jgi:hypothetical protein
MLRSKVRFNRAKVPPIKINIYRYRQTEDRIFDLGLVPDERQETNPLAVQAGKCQQRSEFALEAASWPDRPNARIMTNPLWVIST